jgi:hypothetical protein
VLSVFNGIVVSQLSADSLHTVSTPRLTTRYRRSECADPDTCTVSVERRSRSIVSPDRPLPRSILIILRAATSTTTGEPPDVASTLGPGRLTWRRVLRFPPAT